MKRDTQPESYTAATVQLARTLRNGGWTIPEIRDHVERDTGRRPTAGTIRRWVDAEFAQQRRESQRRESHRRRAEHAVFTLPGDSPTYRAAFMRRLDEEGVPDPSIAKVCTVVFGEQFTTYDVKVALQGGVTRNLMRAVA